MLAYLIMLLHCLRQSLGKITKGLKSCSLGSKIRTRDFSNKKKGVLSTSEKGTRASNEMRGL